MNALQLNLTKSLRALFLQGGWHTFITHTTNHHHYKNIFYFYNFKPILLQPYTAIHLHSYHPPTLQDHTSIHPQPHQATKSVSWRACMDVCGWKSWCWTRTKLRVWMICLSPANINCWSCIWRKTGVMERVMFGVLIE